VIAALLLAAASQVPATPVVVVTVPEPEEVRLVAGEKGEVCLVATIRSGFRIQANPASEPYLVPANVSFEEDEHVRLGSPEYPPGKPHRLRGASSDLSIYEESVTIRVPVEASSSEVPSSGLDVVLDGSLVYQACNNAICLKPSSAPVRIRLRIRPVEVPAR